MMIKKYLSVAIVICLLTACHSSSIKRKQIDYATLDTLQTTIGLKIGESKQFLPGQLQNLLITAEGDIVVSDRATKKITQFDNNGNFVATIAKKGKGPGELSQYFTMRLIDADTLLANQFVGKKNYYVRGSHGTYRFARSEVIERIADRPLTVISPQSDTAYYARTGKLIKNFQQAVKNQKPYEKSVIVLINRSGKIIKDSLALLKRGTNFYSMAGGGLHVEGVPYRYDDWFVPGDDGSYMIARVDSSAFNFYDNQQQLQRSVSVDVKSRPVTDEDLDYGLQDADKQTRSNIAARVADQKPPFLHVWRTDTHLWLQIDKGKNGQQIVALNMDGTPAGKFRLPVNDDIKATRGNQIYVIHHGSEKGDTIRRYDVSL